MSKRVCLLFYTAPINHALKKNIDKKKIIQWQQKKHTFVYSFKVFFVLRPMQILAAHKHINGLLFTFKTLVNLAAFEHKMAAETPMRHVDSYARRCSSLQVGSHQPVTLLVGSTVFVAAHCLGSCACVCARSLFSSLSAAVERLEKSDTICFLSVRSSSFSSVGVYLTGGEVGDPEERKLGGHTPTWRRKRAFIFRSNHGSSWYAGKLKGGRGGLVWSVQTVEAIVKIIFALMKLKCQNALLFAVITCKHTSFTSNITARRSVCYFPCILSL